jgi:hypothetical protein
MNRRRRGRPRPFKPATQRILDLCVDDYENIFLRNEGFRVPRRNHPIYEEIVIRVNELEPNLTIQKVYDRIKYKIHAKTIKLRIRENRRMYAKFNVIYLVLFVQF